MYIDSTNCCHDSSDQTVAARLREELEPLMRKYDVDLQFGAHHHSYQRSCPLYNGRCVSSEEEGYSFIVVDIGMAGAGNSRNTESEVPAIWEVVDEYHHGYTTIEANMTSLKMVYKRGYPAQVADEFTLWKSPASEPASAPTATERWADAISADVIGAIIAVVAVIVIVAATIAKRRRTKGAVSYTAIDEDSVAEQEFSEITTETITMSSDDGEGSVSVVV